MDSHLRAWPILVETGSADEQGCMILANDHLVAILVKIERNDVSPEMAGYWHLEAGFGPCDMGPARTVLFETRDNGQEWVRGRMRLACPQVSHRNRGQVKTSEDS